jgi:hypothetical protein
MGLDMYIRHGEDSDEIYKREGYEGWKRELCYWRKHPDLHGYIVQAFADGVDECQQIELDTGRVAQILAASEEDRLPHTEGFFFGTSVPEDKEDTRAQLTALLAWMEQNPTARVFYCASW